FLAVVVDRPCTGLERHLTQRRFPGRASCGSTVPPGAGSGMANTPPATFHKPVSPTGAPQFTVPSGQRGVGRGFGAFPAPPPLPLPWANDWSARIGRSIRTAARATIDIRCFRTVPPQCCLTFRQITDE